jgi:hypothetical protein
MPDTYVNRLQCAISNTPGTTGAFTVAAATSGRRTFGAAQNAQTFTVLVKEGTAWEVRNGCTYTHSGTSLSRGTLEDSSTGSAINFTSAAIVTVTLSRGGLDAKLDTTAAPTITATKSSPVDADQLILLDSAAANAPVLTTMGQLLAGVYARLTALESAAPVAPSAFTAGQWTAAATATPGEISFNLTALPSNGGSAITALQYRVGTGSAIAFTGTGTGVRVVTAGLTAGVAVDLQVRAVNAIGSGAWSDTKNRTPLASGGSAAISGTGTSSPGFGSTRTIPVPGSAATGRRLLVMFDSSAAVTSMTDDQGTSYTNLAPTNAGANDRVFISAALGGTLPTTITVTLASSAFIEKADVYVLTGATATIANQGALSTGFSVDPRSHAYTTTAANELVFGSIDFPGGGVTGATGADGTHTWLLTSGGGYFHRFGIVRATAGSYGATVGPAGSGSASSGFWFSLTAA